jgi:hypothetical protein
MHALKQIGYSTVSYGAKAKIALTWAIIQLASQYGYKQSIDGSLERSWDQGRLLRQAAIAENIA